MAATVPFASASLYVGDLNNDVTETTLFEIFSQVGPVVSIRVCRDAVSRRSLGYAYVNYHSVNDAERALDTLNFTQIKGRPCRVMWSQRDPSVRKSGVGNVFIKNLDKSIDNKELFDTFSVFGNILSVKIAQSHDGQSLGYGFVHFDSDEAATKSIEQVNGKVIKDKAVSVAPFVPKSDPRRSGGDKSKWTNVFVKNLPADFNKEKLDALFGQYGPITNSVTSVSTASDGKQRAFGFVNFETTEQAAAAVAGLHDTEVDGSKLFVCRAQKKAEREKFLRDRFEQIKQERAKKYQGTNLYLKNLSDETTEEQLNAEFSKYGPITSTKIMHDEAAGRSRGFGFVCFTNAEDASRAIAEQNGKLFQGKPLYVAIAQRKEQRRQMLEIARAKQMMAAGAFMPGAAPMYFPAPAGMQGRPGAAPAGFMYPPQMMPGMRFPGGRPPYPLPAGQMPPPGYALVPAQVPMGQPRGPRGPRPQGGAPQQGQQGPRQGGAPRQGAPQGVPQQPRQGGAPQGGNRNVKPAAGQEGAVVPGGAEPLTLATLVNAPPELQKQLIGERLYPLIAQQQPELAGKITGMLLEMDNAELLELLDNSEARHSKIVEAVRVLQEAVASGDS